MEENNNTNLQQQAELEQQNSNESNNQNIIATVKSIKLFNGENIDEDNYNVVFNEHFKGFKKDDYGQYVEDDVNYISFRVNEFYKKFFGISEEFGYFFRKNRKTVDVLNEFLQENHSLTEVLQANEMLFDLNEQYRKVTTGMSVKMNRCVKTSDTTGRNYYDTEIIGIVFNDSAKKILGI